MRISKFILSSILFLSFMSGLRANDPNVFVLRLFDEIHPGTARYMSKGIQAAHDQNADYILVHMNTYGGLVESADSIRTALLKSKITTVVFIDKNAASAGALISLACDSIYMGPGSSMGAVTVVSGETGEAMPDKYQSYMRATMRATALENGRDPKIAEKMVDQSLEIEGLSPKGSVITFTAEEALKHGFSNGSVKSLEEVYKRLNLENPKITTHENDTVEGIIQFLINPVVSGILMMLIFGGLFMEFKTPGMGFPAIIALIAATVFFAPHYLEGLADNWEILTFSIGILLIAAEVFIIPGFGIAGILGITFSVFGMAVALLRNDFMDFTLVSGTEALRSFAIVFMSMAGAIILVVNIAKRVVTEELDLPFILKGNQDKEKGYTAFDSKLLSYVSKEAICQTDLKPSGFIMIDDKRLDAESEGGFIPAGTKVSVLKVRGMILLVREA